MTKAVLTIEIPGEDPAVATFDVTGDEMVTIVITEGGVSLHTPTEPKVEFTREGEPEASGD